MKHIGFSLEHMFSQFTSANPKLLKSHFQSKANKAVVRSTTTLGGAHEAVTSLFESGYKLGIATTKIRSNIDGILRKLGWKNYFHEVLGGDEVTRNKPDPEQFSSLMTLMKADQKNTVIVGDTINDILPAKKLSVSCVAIRSPHGDFDEVMKLKPDYFIEELSQLPIIIGEIFERKQLT